MTLLLDTCTVIDVLREGRPHVRARLQEAVAAGEALALSSLTLHELVFGARISTRPDVELALIDRFVGRTQVEAWTADDAAAAARVRADLKRTGERIGAIDVLIAGQALNRGWPVVTANVREFTRVEGLRLLDWSDPAGAREIDRASKTPRPQSLQEEPK